MLFIILGILTALGLAIGIPMWIYFENARHYNSTLVGTGATLTVLGIVIAIASIVLAATLLPTNTSSAAKFEAFYNANAQNYATATQKTEDMLTVSLEAFTEKAMIPIEGSIEKWELGTSVSNRIAEWRDAVNRYNTQLATYRRYDKNSWLGLYWPNLPDELKPITIK